MAEAVGSAIVQAAVQQQLSEAYGKFNSVFMEFKSNMESLQNSRGIIEAVLCDFDSAGITGNRTHVEQVTVDKIRCQLDRLMDFLDVKEYRALLRQVMGGSRLMKEVRLFFSSSNQLFVRFKDAGIIKDIRKQLDSIARDHAQFGNIVSFRPSCSQAQEWSVQTTALHIISDLVVGREKDKEAIISMISDDSLATEILSVSAITGIGGVGKTTLAWYVYNDEMVKRNFEVQFWVDVTEEFNVKEMVEKIASSCAIFSEIDNQPYQCYDHFIRAMAGKKYLLVLDNIWDQQGLRLKWLNLRRLLEFGAYGSKVLITTRDRKVAGLMDSQDPYLLSDLTEGDSWLLFQQVAFTEWQEPGVKAVGKEIARMCPRVPLVLRSVGSVLAGKSTVQEWQAFRDDQFTNFASYGRDIISTLKLSYDQLDPKLKLCVLYCSLFHKQYRFKKDVLISLWVALGYVVPKYKKQSLEEAGEEYLASLVNNGFLKISGSKLGCSIVSITMHDLFHDLITSLAGSKYKMADSNTNEFEKGVRHVSIVGRLVEDFVWDVPSSLFKIKHLESFIMATDSRYATKVSNWCMCDKYLSRFEFLKVLVLRKLPIREVPKSVGKLLSLRYLDLSETDIVKLPNSITSLVNLLSLLLVDCNCIWELPKDFSKLVKLRHLKLGRDGNLTHMPIGLEKLTDLRTLDMFVVSEQSSKSEFEENIVGGLADLNGLNHLMGVLSIKMCRESNDMVADARIANLKMKEKLEHLIIDFQRGTKEDEVVLESLQPHANLKFLHIVGYGGERLPTWMMDNQLHYWLPSLVSIVIRDCKSCRFLCSLGRLPHLRELFLKGLDNVEYIESNNSDNDVSEDELLPNAPLFPSLHIFHIIHMPRLKAWWRMSSSGNQDSSRDQNQYRLVEWKPKCPKLYWLAVDDVELAIVMARSLLRGFTSVPRLMFLKKLMSTPSQQRHPLLLLNSHLPNLRRLSFNGINDLEVFPQEFQNFSSLEELELLYLKKFMAIPDWIDSLTSLKALYIRDCPRLDSLPYQICRLSKLRSLSILKCSILLEERCQNPIGECWPLIKHIPYLHITAADLF